MFTLLTMRCKYASITIDEGYLPFIRKSIYCAEVETIIGVAYKIFHIWMNISG